MADETVDTTGHVKAFDRLGNKVMVPKDQVGQLYAMGGRVARKDETAAAAADEAYEGKSTIAKVGGALAPALPLPAQAAARAYGAALPPELEAYRSGASGIMTGGLEEVGTQKLAGAIGGDEAAKAYTQQLDQANEAHPGYRTAGQIAGVAGSIVAGGPKGGLGAAGKAAIPGVGISALGGLAEEAVGRQLGGLAAKGALGRAAATGAGMAVRGAIEGAGYAGMEQASQSALHDDPIVGQKLYAALGHGALTGGILGGVLGTAGSLGASGVRAASRSLFSPRAATTLAEATAPVMREPVPFVNPSAGLDEAAPAAEQAFAIGPAAQEVGLRPNAFASSRSAAPEVAARRPFTFRNEMGIDPDAGIYAPEPRAGTPLFSRFTQGSNKATRRAAVESGLFEGAEDAHNVQLAGDVFRGLRKGERLAATTKPIQEGTTFRINPDAGLSPSQMAKGEEVADVFRMGKAQPRGVGLADVEGPASVGEGPISLAKGGTSPGPSLAKSGVEGMLSAPNDAVRGLAQEQAWKAMAGGFGLQSTRHAKEAMKYFGDPRALGEIAFKYRIIDPSETATPWQAAWKAAQDGTPEAMRPKLTAALDGVGAKIGDITDASGARIPIAKALAPVNDVVRQYQGQAGRGPLAAAASQYGAELQSVLKPGPDGAVSVRSLLEQRKILDDIVYEENKALDPRGRIKALREIRGKLEGVITDALDDASGKVKGDLAAEYRGLKRDYHGLSILSSVTEDSAARAAKGATFGLGEKFAAGSALASGHFAAAPVLAVGGKLLKERGNAAAAAFLARAADTGMVDNILSAFGRRVQKSAVGALRETPTIARSPEVTREEGRAAVLRTQADAQKVVQWAADTKASPDRLMGQLEDASATVSRAAGPNAANAYTAATLRAIQFIQGYIPARDRRDPLDPRSVPPLTFDESDRLLRATKYAVHPSTVFVDFERGIVTPEGVQAAKTFMPDAFQEFREALFENVQQRLRKGERYTQSQRLRIDKLLEYPAGADLRPAAIAQLQANLTQAPEGPQTAVSTGGSHVDMKVQQSGFDAVEARKSG